MTFQGSRRLVVLGFGAIGAGLFAYEAQRAGIYAPPVVADVQSDLVAAIRDAGGRCRVNIARADRVDVAQLVPLEAVDASAAAQRARLIEAISTADEVATALPSVALYRTDTPGSPHTLLAQALLRRIAPRPLLVLCAENHRAAARLLESAVLEAVDAGQRDVVRARARFVDTVIGKMSGVVGAEEAQARGLATIAPSLARAFLVEEFDRILVARAGADEAGPLRPGMPALREVADLGPFEDAKLLGHNATHALAGFLGSLLDLTRVTELRGVPGAMAFLRAAFVGESGEALMGRHAGADPLFTPAGFATYADDLLGRMVNPFLADSVERAARDPVRKLGWEDRLVGLIRLGLAQGVPMPRYAMGVAAGLEALRRSGQEGADAELLAGCWPADVDAAEAARVMAVAAGGARLLEVLRGGGFEAVSARLES